MESPTSEATTEEDELARRDGSRLPVAPFTSGTLGALPLLPPVYLTLSIELPDRAGLTELFSDRLLSRDVCDMASCDAYTDSGSREETLSRLYDRKKLFGSGAGRGETGTGSRSSSVVRSIKRARSALWGLQGER